MSVEITADMVRRLAQTMSVSLLSAKAALQIADGDEAIAYERLLERRHWMSDVEEEWHLRCLIRQELRRAGVKVP